MGRKTTYLVSALIVAATSLASCTKEKLSEPMSDADLAVYASCTRDEECTYVLNGCCDCANGGKDVAVRKDQAQRFRSQFACNVPCTERAGDCARGIATCKAGQCTFERTPR